MSIRTPKDIYDKLSKTVFGQEQAKKSISVLMNYTDPTFGNNKINPRIFLIGQTGSGKTFLLDELEKALKLSLEDQIFGCLPLRLFVKIDASLILPNGAYDGGVKIGSIEKYISSEISRKFLELKKYSHLFNLLIKNIVVVIDEFDKLCVSGIQGDGFYRKAQSDFLTFIEGKELNLTIGNLSLLEYENMTNGIKNAFISNKGETSIIINTKDIPIIFMGAFDEANVYSFKNKSNSIGFFPSGINYEEENIKEKLIKYGLMREMAGRITKIIVMNKPDYKFYEDILDKQLIPHIEQQLLYLGKSIKFTEEYKKQLINLALRRKEGARTLKELLFNDLENYLFDLMSVDITKFSITEYNKDEMNVSLRNIL